MNKYRYLLKNIGILMISNFSSKLLSFFLVPLYTQLLSTSEYGIFDIINTTISLLIPLLTFGITDAVLRFCLDDKYDSKDIFCIGLKFILSGSVFVILVYHMNRLLHVSVFIETYGMFFVCMFIVNTLSQLLTYYARGVDDVPTATFSSVLCTFVTIALNIYFLVYLRMGLDGYFLATIIGHGVQDLFLIIKLKIWKVLKIRKIEKSLQSEMLKYSVPLIASSVGWWITNLSDRYIVTYMCGIEENGIYSIGYKIPEILNVFQMIFNQAWILSSVKEYQNNEYTFFSNIYSIYNFCMVFICSCVIMTTKISASFLYSAEFYAAWKFVPFLTISIVFGALCGVMTGVFSAIKDTKSISYSVVIGAVINIVLNIFLIKCFGSIGAAIATLLAYFTIWLIRYVMLKKYNCININMRKDLISYCILICQALTLFIHSNIWIYSIEVILLIVILYINREVLMKVWLAVKNKIKNMD